jgi:hypothetical protein
MCLNDCWRGPGLFVAVVGGCPRGFTVAPSSCTVLNVAGSQAERRLKVQFEHHPILPLEPCFSWAFATILNSVRWREA